MKKKTILFLILVIMALGIWGCGRSTEVDTNGEGDALQVSTEIWPENVAITRSGVIESSINDTSSGYNLYFNDYDRAYLIDNQGNPVHVWFLPYINGPWEHGVIRADGSLVACFADRAVTAIDWYSSPLWYTEMRAHHDMALLDDGTLLIPGREAREYNGRTVLFDTVTRMDTQGTVTGRWSTWENLAAIREFHSPSFLDKAPEDPAAEEDAEYTYYQLSSVSSLPATELGTRDTRFREGNWLISLTNVHLLLILDRDTREIVWNWGPGQLDEPCSAVMTKDGTILIYGKGGIRGHSRIVKADPVLEKVVWEFKTNPSELFYSPSGGTVQPLPNGNILVTNRDNGQAFEVTEDKEVVWVYYAPAALNNFRKRIFAMKRYPLQMIDNLMDQKPIDGSRIGVIDNPGFEESSDRYQGQPAGWKLNAWQPEAGRFVRDGANAHSGRASAAIQFPGSNVGYWGQSVRVKHRTQYSLSGWIRTRNIPEGEVGASVSVQFENKWPLFSRVITGNTDWTQVTLDFETPDIIAVEVQAKIGASGAETSGNAWFDDLVMEEIE